MAKNKLPKDISEVKDANDACYLITKLTESYADDSGSPEDRFIYDLRQVALKGLQTENESLKAKLKDRKI